ncbi:MULTISPECIES: dihydroorotase [unclassified Campylobacter]|uniref:dihydroorotase n=1 Tax=unclassified Campylobacter TaxID=2593542 RepID=UPI001238294E|nr:MULTISPECIES: dihydroorotase [unclassified Campylobacter]KAA6226512.1 dihydroorotase [Campylobacter sp. LR196d]KAA6227003.1 dihydroorotase [Campylobacter sp. LR185c]KAA6228158.1 dihydroorotase [Campylobacter sp. LR286c]KAA6229980.1 dihydroorotase [Campylobacter sp. LR291e]KAA8603176.1 dihydroorotase [Campylobacter sp. LR185c]
MKLKNPLDMHLHLRDKNILKLVTPLSSKDFRAGVIMPNLIPPLCNLKALKAYKKRILKISENDNFTPLMTLFFKDYDFKFLEKIKNELFAIKLYPAGITTNSSNGVSSFDLEKLKPTLSAMSELKIPLLVHGETSDFVMDREANFAKIYEKLAKNFPNLKIVMEHITTKRLCNLLKDYENLYATITLHHLMLTLDDVIGGKMCPHLFCKPIAKTYKDKDALCELAFSGFEKVMFGSDSAPHPKSDKENCGCAAGVFSAPVILCELARLFNKHSNEKNLQKFISDNACKIHNLKFKNEKIITLKKEKHKVPLKYGTLIPFLAGQNLEFKIIY